MEIFTVTMQDIEKALNPKPSVDLSTLLPEEYHEFLHLFSRETADQLLPHRPCDHTIPLIEGKQPPFGPLYGMSLDELKVLRKYLDDNLAKGFIRPSSSPAAAPILFVRKPGGGLRLCVDDRGLNAITIKNRYPLPLVKETLNLMCGAVIFTKLDVVAAFHNLRMKLGEEYKTAFRLRLGLYEFLVMPFGLANAPSSFQAFINEMLREFLDKFCTAYMDDILIFSRSRGKHRRHVKAVLQALSEAGLHLDIEKCEFNVTEVVYLGIIVITDSIRMDLKKIQAILDWEDPLCTRDVQSFIGFANFYRRFIKDFSKVAAPMIALTRKDKSFFWSTACKDAFRKLRDLFTTAPILMHFNHEKEVIVETDASDHVSAGILSQYDDDGVLRPVAFFSKKHSPQEVNYEIYDKELLAIIRAFEEWRSELEKAAFPIQVITDHKNLEYFMTTKQLSRCQARWSEYFTRFNFRIVYRPGRLHGKPDALTRRLGDLPKEGDKRITQQNQVVLKPQNVELLAKPEGGQPIQSCNNIYTAVNSSNLGILANQDHDQAVESESGEAVGPRENEESNTENDGDDQNDDKLTEDLFVRGYQQDPFPEKILDMLRKGTRRSREISLADCSDVEGRLLYRGRIYVPDLHQLRLRLTRQYHDTPVAGHRGQAKTYELLSREYYWPQMIKFVERYIRNCHTCGRGRSWRHKKQGLLRPPPVPERRWRHITMDFVTGLPLVNGFDAVLNVVDRLSKLRHIIPCSTTITSKDLAKLFIDHVWKHHGLPESCISDRGSLFVSDWWRHLCRRLKVTCKLSTAYHPETDGQTEIANAYMEQYLRMFISYYQDNWPDWVALAEFVSNDIISTSITVTPFFANSG